MVPSFRGAAFASAHPVMRRWWAHMADTMETKPDDAPVAKPLATVFHMT